MPASRARSSPAASSRFEITIAILAGRRFSSTASIRAWRLLPRPEIRTPIAGTSSTIDIPGVDDSFASGANFADAHDARLARSVQRSDELTFAIGCTRNDEADAHVERAQH